MLHVTRTHDQQFVIIKTQRLERFSSILPSLVEPSHILRLLKKPVFRKQFRKRDVSTPNFSLKGNYKNTASRLYVPFAAEKTPLLPALERFPSLLTADSEIPTYALLANTFMPCLGTTQQKSDQIAVSTTLFQWGSVVEDAVNDDTCYEHSRLAFAIVIGVGSCSKQGGHRK